MVYFVSAVRWILTAGSIIVFPILAVNAFRRGGLGPLGRLAGTSLAIIVVCALLLASHTFGNRSAPEIPYVTTALNVVALFLLMFGFPVIAASVTAIALGNEKFPPWAAAAVAMGAAAAAFVVAIIAGINLAQALS